MEAPGMAMITSKNLRQEEGGVGLIPMAMVSPPRMKSHDTFRWAKGRGSACRFVEENGTIWIPQDGEIVKFSRTGFSGGIPQYNFGSPVKVVDKAHIGKLIPGSVKVAGNGDIWVAGNGPAPVPPFNAGLAGHAWFARFDQNGNQLLLRPTPDSPIAAIAVDENPASSTYVVTGHARWIEFWVDMWDSDGLLVAQAHAGRSHQPTGLVGSTRLGEWGPSLIR